MWEHNWIPDFDTQWTGYLRPALKRFVYIPTCWVCHGDENILILTIHFRQLSFLNKLFCMFGKNRKDRKGNKNKRSQRALCRPPEEKVKGHSGAIYKGPLMLSTKYWSRKSNMKALALVLSDKNIFENCILKTYFVTPWLTYATNQNH